jgi:hypothetical protein
MHESVDTLKSSLFLLATFLLSLGKLTGYSPAFPAAAPFSFSPPICNKAQFAMQSMEGDEKFAQVRPKPLARQPP